MQVEHGKIEGDVEITGEFQMHGMFTGNVVVKAGGSLMLHGMATKSVTLESGSFVNVFGIVSGDVTNNGGRLQVSGIVTGKVIEN
ncbi:hypothetical protein MNO15_004664 [Vibrio parahaemolyticus]|nr:hypothetical protein [Vibrio parahaemolyticus]